MQLNVLEKSDLDRVVATNGVRSIWQIDRLVDNALADPATKRYLSRVMSTNHSLGISKNDELCAYVIGSIPKWDTDFFGFDSYVVRYLWYDSKESLEYLLEGFDDQMKDWGVRYVYAKLPTDEISAIRAFERLAFTLADLRVTFNKKLVGEKLFPTNFGNLIFELANEDDIESIAELSKAVSKADRFHSDPNIPVELADELYYKWVVNGGAAGKDTIKCTVEGELAGFHMSYPEEFLEPEGITPLSISDIMGVYPKFGGRGIGTGLFANYFGMAESKGQKSVIAGVHIDNTISMRLHEGVGFKVIHSEIGLRKWY